MNKREQLTFETNWNKLLTEIYLTFFVKVISKYIKDLKKYKDIEEFIVHNNYDKS